jgi:hypothetical protein
MGAKKWTKEDYANLLAEYKAGARQSDMAKRLGLSRERVRQALLKAMQIEMLATSDDPLESLSTRVRNCLRANGACTVEKVLALVDSGAIDDVPNLGNVGKVEVMRWLLCSVPNSQDK